MSGSAAKTSRRKLRKAVGETTALALVEQSNLMASHDMLIATHSRQIAAIISVLDRHGLREDKPLVQLVG